MYQNHYTRTEFDFKDIDFQNKGSVDDVTLLLMKFEKSKEIRCGVLLSIETKICFQYFMVLDTKGKL